MAVILELLCPLPSSYCLISLSASLIFSPPYFLFPFLLTPTPTSRLIPYLGLPSSPLNPQTHLIPFQSLHWKKKKEGIQKNPPRLPHSRAAPQSGSSTLGQSLTLNGTLPRTAPHPSSPLPHPSSPPPHPSSPLPQHSLPQHTATPLPTCQLPREPQSKPSPLGTVLIFPNGAWQDPRDFCLHRRRDVWGKLWVAWEVVVGGGGRAHLSDGSGAGRQTE